MTLKTKQTIILVLHGVKSKESLGLSQVAKVRALAAERGLILKELVTEHPGHCEELIAKADFTVRSPRGFRFCRRLRSNQ